MVKSMGDKNQASPAELGQSIKANKNLGNSRFLSLGILDFYFKNSRFYLGILDFILGNSRIP